MLVLTRREGEGLMIGTHTTVHVLQMRGSQVRIGIDTPRGTPVLRNEVYEKELQRRAETEDSVFPQIYRAWSKTDRTISGYALELPATESPRYDYEPINSPEDLATNDHFLDIYLFSSEGEASALAMGVKLAAKPQSIGVVYGRKGAYWVALVDYFTDHWHDRTERVRLFDYTIYRYEGTTSESKVQSN